MNNNTNDLEIVMNKLVYLHELDSVRNTPEEILRGQQAMYQEIVINGNSVVLTYNQFTDSKAFLCAVKNEEQYKHILELFRKGYIKLSNFVMKEFEKDEDGTTMVSEIDIYTPSQYIQHALDKNKKKKQNFIFSGLQLDSDETELMEIMGDALKYSNTSVFDIYEPKSKEDKDRIGELIKYTKMLLAISVEELAYNPIKRENQITLNELMTKILEIKWNESLIDDIEFAKLFAKSIEILKEVKVQLADEQINARSNWLKMLYQKNTLPEVELAEAIVLMAYNYVVEDSIANVAKHYDDSDGMNGLMLDFAHRIQLYWKEHVELGLHELHNPSNNMASEEWNKILSWEKFPDWETAVRVTGKKDNLKKQEKENVAQNNVKRLYEDDYESDRKKWRKKLGKTILLQILIAFAYIILIHIFNQLTGGIEEIVAFLLGILGLELSPLLSGLVNLVIYTLILGMFSSYVSKKLNLPDILESVDDIINSIKDMKNIRIARKYVSYVWLKEK